MRLLTLMRHPLLMLKLTGVSALIIGSLYYPVLPWYILGQVKESEIARWGLLSMAGGVATVGGAALLGYTSSTVRKGLLLIALIGMAVLLLAQVPAILMWLFYGGAFAKQWMPWEPLGLLIGLLLHGWLSLCSVGSMIASVKALRGGIQPELKLSARGWLSFGGALLLVLGGWWGWEQYQNRHWLASISPQDGAVDVPRNATVSAAWKGAYDSMGMRIDYADAPDAPTPGVTAATPYGISFTPEQPFLPGRKVKVTIEAGRRTHTITFTTAREYRTERRAPFMQKSPASANESRLQGCMLLVVIRARSRYRSSRIDAPLRRS